MELSSILIFVALGVLAWRESRATALRSAARNAIVECEEEIQALRGGVMAGNAPAIWRSDIWERRRARVLLSLHCFHRLSYSGPYKEDLTASSVPSFQDEAEWRRWQTLARGPRAEPDSATHPLGVRS